MSGRGLDEFWMSSGSGYLARRGFEQDGEWGVAVVIAQFKPTAVRLAIGMMPRRMSIERTFWRLSTIPLAIYHALAM
jgi:hypothetical protein